MWQTSRSSCSSYSRDPVSPLSPDMELPRNNKSSSNCRYAFSNGSITPSSKEIPSAAYQLPPIEKKGKKDERTIARGRTTQYENTRKSTLPLASRKAVQETSTRARPPTMNAGPSSQSEKHIPKPDLKGKKPTIQDSPAENQKTKAAFKGTENQRKPQLRFSPSPVIKKNCNLASASTSSSTKNLSLRRAAITNSNQLSRPRVSSHGKKTLLRAGASIVSRKINGAPISRYSRIPVAQESKPPVFDQAVRSSVMSSGSESNFKDEDNESTLEHVASPAMSIPGSPMAGASPPVESSPDYIPIYGSSSSWQPLLSPGSIKYKETVTECKIKILNAFGYRGELFDGEKEFIKDLPKLIERLDTKNYNSILTSNEIRYVKIKEVKERIGIVQTLFNISKFNKATVNESGCVKGWEHDFMDECENVENAQCRPHKAWLRHIIDWLWGPIYDIQENAENIETPLGDDLFVINSSSPIQKFCVDRNKKEHELFNLVETGVELIREGFGGNEKKIITLWSDIREAQYVASACGRGIIDQYMSRLTRLDGVVLSLDKIQERRMRYFCIRHYVHWKSAVSLYALSTKMMNLLIVFHDLWGMHIDGMSIQEKSDWGVLHENLYDFALEFQKPAEEGEDDTWNTNECFYCFSQTATYLVDKKGRDSSLWFWILQVAAVAGYGKFHAALLQIMTEGKGRDYCNDMLDSAYWIRQSSMLLGLKRVQCAVRKDARVGCLIRPIGTMNIAGSAEILLADG